MESVGISFLFLSQKKSSVSGSIQIFNFNLYVKPLVCNLKSSFSFTVFEDLTLKELEISATFGIAGFRHMHTLLVFSLNFPVPKNLLNEVGIKQKILLVIFAKIQPFISHF